MRVAFIRKSLNTGKVCLWDYPWSFGAGTRTVEPEENPGEQCKGSPPIQAIIVKYTGSGI